MVYEIDARTTAPLATPGFGEVDGVSSERRDELDAAAASASRALPGDHEVRVVSVDPESGGAAVLVSDDAQAIDGNYVARALRHVQTVGQALGLEPGQPPEFVADPGYQVTSAGGVAVHLRQLLLGIPIYDAAETVRFDPDGRLIEVAGRTYPAEGEVVDPTVTAAQALAAAARHLATADPEVLEGDEAPRDQFGEPTVEPTLDLSAFAPRQLTAPSGGPDLASVFTAPPLDGPITVSLIWFPLAGEVRLSWHLRTAASGGPVYRFIVDADDARILLCRKLTSSIVGKASVVLRAGAARTAVDFPLDPASYGPPVPPSLPAGWPDGWLVDATTSGSCARAINVAAGNSVVTGSRVGDVVTFQPPSDIKADNQLVVNLFAFCSIMHDALYLLGFREVDGNFQRDSKGRGGRPADAVLAKVHPGAVNGTANMGTPVDGLAPVMNMGLVTSTGRHTALDPDVVYHEYTHGLTNRLVGGPMNDSALDAEQSGGMGEGWSDYVACTFLDKTVVGDWVVNRPRGIRRNAYTDAFPGTYAQLGTPAYSEVHDIGELWCATVMSLGRTLGTWAFLQIVVDALKLTAANPSLLAARDAILLAAKQYRLAAGDSAAAADAYVAKAWVVFARYGMGPNATTNGATLTGIVADFNPPGGSLPPPQTLHGEAAPALVIPDNNATGVTSTITLAGAGSVVGVKVAVAITHTWVGDLVVSLTAPGGSSVVLQNRAGGSADDLRATWDSSTTPAMAPLLGGAAAGSWSLKVADRAGRDVGRLDTWSVDVTAS